MCTKFYNENETICKTMLTCIRIIFAIDDVCKNFRTFGWKFAKIYWSVKFIAVVFDVWEVEIREI